MLRCNIHSMGVDGWETAVGGLADTVAALAAYRWDPTAASNDPFVPGLADIEAFGSNPGALRMRLYVPGGLDAGAPLVVVLHGCTQTAQGFADRKSVV